MHVMITNCSCVVTLTLLHFGDAMLLALHASA